MTGAQALQERGLLDATTVLTGLREHRLSASDVSAWAVEELLAQDGDVDPDLAALTSAESSSELDVQDLLETRAADETTSAEVARQRWMLADLLSLRAESLGDEDRLDRLDELYADHGYPEELRWISRDNFTPEERTSLVGPAPSVTSPLDAADAAIASLEAALLPEQAGGATTA